MWEVLRRQRQVDLSFQGQSALQSKFQDRKDYSKKLCFEKPKMKKKKTVPKNKETNKQNPDMSGLPERHSFSDIKPGTGHVQSLDRLTYLTSPWQFTVLTCKTVEVKEANCETQSFPLIGLCQGPNMNQSPGRAWRAAHLKMRAVHVLLWEGSGGVARAADTSRKARNLDFCMKYLNIKVMVNN